MVRREGKVSGEEGRDGRGSKEGVIGRCVGRRKTKRNNEDG